VYLIIWEFQIKQGRKLEFEHCYGPSGPWAKLFQQGQGYLGTELLHDAVNSTRYLTIDTWASKEAYESFRSKWDEAYQRLDEQGESLTEQETEIGFFHHL
jgi:heme-degrading monooxygenase HmoA